MNFKSTLLLSLVITLGSSSGFAETKRKPAAYSDQEIAKNESEKFLTSIGINPRNVRIKILSKAEAAAKAIKAGTGCSFNRSDYWYAYGLDGGCGVNAGVEAGLTSAMFKVNQKIQCTLGGPVPSNCTIQGTMELDGLNGCTGGPIDTGTGPPALHGKTINPGKTPTTMSNVCLTPAQLETIRKQWTSFNPMPGTRLLSVFVGGYPGINCMGGWGVTVNFGTCTTTPHIPNNPVD